ncbi:MAG TPA: diguanylate cyclase [Candidatus Dormibacteraeota bacterium]|nr:diguanylate cyclase [Candidatus Dormibacteraeota bacterium]
MRDLQRRIQGKGRTGSQDIDEGFVAAEARAPVKPMEAAAPPTQPVARLAWRAAVRPKALAGRPLGPVVAAIVVIGLAVLLYRFQRDAGFAVLAALGGATGWLLAARSARLVAVAEIAAVAGCLWFRLLPWPAALVEVGVLTSAIALAHLAAEREAVVGRSAAKDRRIEGLTLLLETVESLAAAPDVEQILNVAVLASARGISRSGHGRAAHAAFHSVVGEQLNISVVADAPVEREIAVGFEYPIERNQAARGAIRIGRSAFVRPDHMTGPLRELADRLGWQVLIMAPVYTRGSLQGLLAATARDGPAVDTLQQYMLGTLARLTSQRLESTARMDQYVQAAEKAKAEKGVPMLLPAIVDELRDAVKPIKNQILDLRASRNRGGEDVARTFGKLDDLISALASRTAIDPTTGVLSRELGLAALERDVMRARRTNAAGHCVAVLSVATSGAPNAAELIRLVADRLRDGLRREDLIFRYAEDEFVCSFADMDSAQALPILSRIQTELGAQIGYTPFTIGLKSVGLESLGLEQTAG